VTKAKENGHEICDNECEKHAWGRLTEDSGRRYINICTQLSIIRYNGGDGNHENPVKTNFIKNTIIPS
jgi:hypothetical protein